MNFPNFYEFNSLGDDRGNLVVLDNTSKVPFNIKRIYYLFNTKSDITRGLHAHKNLHQLAVCVSGSCRMLLDDGYHRKVVQLNNPLMGLDLPPMLWHEMDQFSNNCVLLVLASDYYDQTDYIRDYDHFKFLVKTNGVSANISKY